MSSPKSFKYKDLLGPLHTDDGFRLRSMERFSQREFPLKISLNKLKCPLFDGEIGCYWIRIHKPKAFKYEYIGRSAAQHDGIRKRLTSHFRELCNLPADPNGKFTMRNIRGYYDRKNNKSFYGITTSKEREELTEEGIDLISIPWLNKEN